MMLFPFVRFHSIFYQTFYVSHFSYISVIKLNVIEDGTDDCSNGAIS